MEDMATGILIIMLGIMGIASMAILVLLTIVSFFVAMPVWLVASIALSGGLLVAVSGVLL